MKTQEIAILDFGFGLEDELKEEVCFDTTNSNSNSNSGGCSCGCSCGNIPWWEELIDLIF